MHILLTHEQADFDALGALLGAALLNEQALPVLPRRINRNARAFLALYGAELPFIEPRELPGAAIEQITLVDTQSLVTLKGMGAKTRVHIVDHHQPRPDLPAGWIVTGDRVGSCTTLLVENLREHNGSLSVVHATLLLLGIYEDTGGLTYVSTSPRDVRAAAYLLEAGASLRLANEYLNPPLAPEQRPLYEQLLHSAESHLIHGQNIVLVCLAIPDVAEEVATLAHKLRDVLDPDAFFLLIGSPEGVRLVARSTTDQVDVSEVAAYFGGGGHERASAALIHFPPAFEVPPGIAPVEAARQELLKLLQRVVRPSVTVSQIMSRRPTLIPPTMPAQTAANLMQKYGYEGYPVVSKRKILGLLTRRSVDRAISHKMHNLPAQSLMDTGEIFVHPGDDIDRLQQVMTESGWGQVPVVDPDSGEIIGIVTRTDLLKTLSGGPALVPGHVKLDRRLDESLPPAQLALLKAIASQATEAHLGAYVVGGFVRDLLLERPSLDFDVVVEGDAVILAESLKERLGGRIVSHSRFGTAKWWIAEIRDALALRVGLDPSINPQDLPESLDLISARTEFYEYPTALPTVERSSIKLDLHRRDFTMNTMAIRLDGRHYGDLYDYWGGLGDLRQGLVRVLHSLSFVDDPTRMLRAVRFEQRFGFTIEPRTLQLMGEAGDLVRQVSGHRLRHELDLILAEERAVAMLARLQELNLLRAIHPNLPWSEEIAARVSIAMESPPDPGWNLPAQFAHLPAWRALAYLAWLGGLALEQALPVAETLRFPVALVDALKQVCQLPLELKGMAGWSPSQVVRRLDSVPVLALCALQYFNLPLPAPDLLNQYLTTWQHIHAVTNGDALRKMGIQPGPVYGQILEALRSAWLDGKISTYEQEKDLLNQWG